MRIRKMVPEDYEKVYALWLACPGMGLNDVDDSEEGIARFLEKNPETCFVAEEERLIGVIMVGTDGRRGYVYHTAVHPDFQRQGVGSALVDTAIEALKGLGITKVALFVFERNAGGNVFWEKQGFTKRTDLAYRNRSLVDMVRIDT